MPGLSPQGNLPFAPNRTFDMWSQSPTRQRPVFARSTSRGRRARFSSRAPSIFLPSSAVRATTHSVGEKLGVFAVAALVLVVVVGGAFAAGYLIGRVLL